MKKVLSLLAIVLVLTSCSKDDATKASIIGKWKVIKIEYFLNNTPVGTELETQDNASCPDYIEIKANGTIEEIENDANCTIKSANSNFTYVGNVITKTVSGQKLTVVELTNTDMTIALSVKDVDIVVDSLKVYHKKIN